LPEIGQPAASWLSYEALDSDSVIQKLFAISFIGKQKQIDKEFASSEFAVVILLTQSNQKRIPPRSLPCDESVMCL
jgi:hypothetical protein